jgi:hypothetical protein
MHHPLKDRFQSEEPVRVLVSAEKLGLIIEALTECRTDWEWDLSQDEDDAQKLTKEEAEGLRHDIAMIDETLAYLKDFLVAP